MSFFLRSPLLLVGTTLYVGGEFRHIDGSPRDRIAAIDATDGTLVDGWDPAADGTVRDVRFLQQSGNPDFDFEALGAVGDCAGQGRFGPLPADYPYESLPIIFDFRPSGDAADVSPRSPFEASSWSP